MKESQMSDQIQEDVRKAVEKSDEILKNTAEIVTGVVTVSFIIYKLVQLFRK